MKTTENITVTNGRLKKAITSQITPIIMPKVNKKIIKAVNDSKMQIGTITKCYPHIDRCEVEINNKFVLCRILHRFGGDLIDFYTPDGDADFCDTLKEPCIIPRGSLECLVLDVNDNTDERILMGYLLSEELIGSNPASPGNLKLLSITGTNDYWVKFGIDGLDIRSTSTPVVNVGETDDGMQEISNVNSEEYYTKSEVDELIQQAIKELKEELGE